MRIRFVGGPLHNRISEVGEPRPVWVIAVPDGDQCGAESYHLNRFRTASGTRYVQYVHESLIAKNGKPEASTYKEKFKKWTLCLGVK